MYLHRGVITVRTPFSLDNFPQGTTMWYLRTTASAAAGDFCGVRAYEATLLHVDRHVDPPAYTVAYLNEGVSVEVQTESHRFPDFSGENAVSMTASSRLLLGPPFGGMDHVSFSCGVKQGRVVDTLSLTDWTMSQLEGKMEEEFTVRILGVVIRSLGRSIARDPALRDGFDRTLAAVTRGKIIELLSADYLTCTSQVRAGVLLLELTVTSAEVVGNALWIPNVLEKLRKIATAALSASRLVTTVEERVDLLARLLAALYAIMLSVSWHDCIQFASSLIPHALGHLLRDGCRSTILEMNTIDCLGLIWKSSPDKRKASSAAEAAELRAAADLNWEPEALDVALAAVSDQTNHSIHERERAARALHYVFLNKSRAQALSLFERSSMGHMHDLLFSMVADETLPSTLRISATKALDVWYSLVTESTEELQQEQEEETDVGDGEAEMARNKDAFKSLLGNEVSEYFESKLSTRTRVRGKLGARDDVLGLILIWLLTLQKIDSSSQRDPRMRLRCGSYIRKSGIFDVVLRNLVWLFPDQTKISDISHAFQRIKSADDKEGKITGTSMLAMFSGFRTVCVLPAVMRSWWTDECTRENKAIIKTFIESSVSTPLAAREVALIGIAAKESKWRSDEMTVRGSAMTGEVVAVYMKDEAKVEIKISLPSSYPLTNVEVECSSKVGVGEGRWKRWVLQIIQMLSMQDGSVVDALLFLKRNIDKEFEGVEPCPICYCILHPKSTALPSLSCPTCSNKFHSQCLYTWFKSSGKSKCVLCQQPFFL